QGKLDDAIARVQAGWAAIRSSGAQIMMPYFMSVLAGALGKAGRIDQALAILADAQATLERTDDNWWEPELLRLKAELILQRSASVSEQATEAIACIRRARALARERGSRSLELRAATSLGRLLVEQGHRSEAQQAVSVVYDWFTEGFETPDLRDARVLIEQLRA